MNSKLYEINLPNMTQESLHLLLVKDSNEIKQKKKMKERKEMLTKLWFRILKQYKITIKDLQP